MVSALVIWLYRMLLVCDAEPDAVIEWLSRLDSS